MATPTNVQLRFLAGGRQFPLTQRQVLSAIQILPEESLLRGLLLTSNAVEIDIDAIIGTSNRGPVDADAFAEVLRCATCGGLEYYVLPAISETQLEANIHREMDFFGVHDASQRPKTLAQHVSEAQEAAAAAARARDRESLTAVISMLGFRLLVSREARRLSSPSHGMDGPEVFARFLESQAWRTFVHDICSFHEDPLRAGNLLREAALAHPSSWEALSLGNLL